MSSGFRFIHAASESFDDLEGFQVDHTGVFNGITSKYTNVIDDLDNLSLKQELYKVEVQPTEKHRKRKKRSSSSTRHGGELLANSHIHDNNRAMSAFIQQPVREDDKRRSASAKSPSPQLNTVIHQIKKQSLVTPEIQNLKANAPGEALTDAGEKRHRRRKTKKRQTQLYKNEPTPGPLTEQPIENLASLEDESNGINISPVNTRNPYKQNRANNIESNGLSSAASPINRSMGSRGLQIEPYATSTPAIPETESFHTTLPLELENPGNISIGESIAIELSSRHEEKEASLVLDMSLHDGTSMRHTSSSIKQSMYSPLSAHSTVENKSFGANVLGVPTPKQKIDSSSLRVDTMPPPSNTSDDTVALKARIKQLIDEKRDSMLKQIEEEKKAVILEKDMIATKLEQEKSRIADISCRIVQNSLTMSMVGDPEQSNNKYAGGKMMDEDLIILGPTHNQEQETEDLVGGDYGEGVVASIVKSPGPGTVHSVKIREMPTESRESRSPMRKVNNSPTKSSTRSSLERKSTSNTRENPMKSKSLHPRRHNKHSVSPESSYSNSSCSKYSFSSPEMGYKHQDSHKSAHKLNSRRYRKSNKYKYLYASIKEMEARQFELLDRIAELAKETKTVRSIGTDSMPLNSSTAAPPMLPVSYMPGSLPTMVANMGMVPMMPVMPQMCIPTTNGLPYPGSLPTTPLQGAFVPQYTQYPAPMILPPHQNYLPYMIGSQSSVPISNETAALISTVSQMIGTTHVRPSVHDTIKGIMTNYGIGK